MTMSAIPSSKSADRSPNVLYFPEDDKNDSFTIDDNKAWWGASPVATPTAEKPLFEDHVVSKNMDSPPNRKEIENVNSEEAVEWWSNSPCKQAKKTGAVFDRFPKLSNLSAREEEGPSEAAFLPTFDSHGFPVNDSTRDWSISPSKQTKQDSVGKDVTARSVFLGKSPKPDRVSLNESYCSTDDEIVSPSKRKSKKKTSKRISVTKVKASDLGGFSAKALINENGEAVTDEQEVQEAIRLWNAELKKKSLAGPSRRASAHVVGSPRKEPRDRRSSLQGVPGQITANETSETAKRRSSSRTRSKSKSRPINEDGLGDKERRRGRSKSMARRKSLQESEVSGFPMESSNGTDVPHVIEMGGETNQRKSAVCSSAKDSYHRGRSVPQRKMESDGGERKRTSSLARGLTKVRNQSASEFGGCKSAHVEEKSFTSLGDSVAQTSLADTSTASSRSGDEHRTRPINARANGSYQSEDESYGNRRPRRPSGSYRSEDECYGDRRRSRSIVKASRSCQSEDESYGDSQRSPSLARAPRSYKSEDECYGEPRRSRSLARSSRSCQNEEVMRSCGSYQSEDADRRFQSEDESYGNPRRPFRSDAPDPCQHEDESGESQHRPPFARTPGSYQSEDECYGARRRSRSLARAQASSQSDDESYGDRRRSPSLARTLSNSSRDSEEARESLYGSRSIVSDDTATSRRRSKSVGVGLRVSEAPQAPVLRKKVPRNNSSNITKRRLSNNRREDDFMKFAQLSIQSDDGFFAQLEEMEHEQIKKEPSRGKSVPESGIMAIGHASSPCMSFQY
jgi:hypothetical protein